MYGLKVEVNRIQCLKHIQVCVRVVQLYIRRYEIKVVANLTGTVRQRYEA